jgi:hypothetical protein
MKTNKKYVHIRIYIDKDFSDKNYFEEIALSEISKNIQMPFGYYTLDNISKKIKEIKSIHNESEQDSMYRILSENLELDFEFAKELNLFEIINTQCFDDDTILKKELITLLYGYSFLLIRKGYLTKDEVELEFRVFDTDYIEEIVKKYYIKDY